jgi:hypothetical protein
MPWHLERPKITTRHHPSKPFDSKDFGVLLFFVIVQQGRSLTTNYVAPKDSIPERK